MNSNIGSDILCIPNMKAVNHNSSSQKDVCMTVNTLDRTDTQHSVKGLWFCHCYIMSLIFQLSI